MAQCSVDWWRVITDLQTQGMTQREIAAAAGCTHATINRLRNEVNASPLYSTGVQILAIWMERHGKGAKDVPALRVRTLTMVHGHTAPHNGAPTDGKPTDHHSQARNPAVQAG